MSVGRREKCSGVHPERVFSIPVRSIVPGAFAGSLVRLGASVTSVGEEALADRPVVLLPNLRTEYFAVASRAAGIIAQTGSALSHLALLLRERSIPVVVPEDDATELLAHVAFVRYAGGSGSQSGLECEC